MILILHTDETSSYDHILGLTTDMTLTHLRYSLGMFHRQCVAEMFLWGKVSRMSAPLCLGTFLQDKLHTVAPLLYLDMSHWGIVDTGLPLV